MNAIETQHLAYFADLGGLTSVDLNFKANSDEMFPLMVAVLKGK